MRAGLTTLLALTLATSASAHHDAAVGRVGGTGLGTRDATALPVPLPRLEVGLAYDTRGFTRTLRGSETYAGRELAAVDVHLVTTSVGFQLESWTSLGVEVPVGLVRTRAGGDDPTSTAGLGDLRLWAARRLANRKNGDRRLAVWGQLGLQAPTGRYADEAAVSLVDLVPDEDGGITVTPYDTRASLGSGVWTPSASFDARITRGRWSAVLGVGAMVPLDRTPDDIRWGADLNAGAGSQVSLRKGTVVLGALAELQHHTTDTLDHKPADTDQVTTIHVGRRTAIRAGAQLGARINKRTTCGAQLRLPVWQHVQGMQLVETWSTTAQCRVGVGLGKPKGG